MPFKSKSDILYGKNRGLKWCLYPKILKESVNIVRMNLRKICPKENIMDGIGHVVHKNV